MLSHYLLCTIIACFFEGLDEVHLMLRLAMSNHRRCCCRGPDVEICRRAAVFGEDGHHDNNNFLILNILINIFSHQIYINSVCNKTFKTCLTKIILYKINLLKPYFTECFVCVCATHLSDRRKIFIKKRFLSCFFKTLSSF